MPVVGGELATGAGWLGLVPTCAREWAWDEMGRAEQTDGEISSAMSAPTPLDDTPLALLSFTLRYRCLCSKTEITSVGISPSSPSPAAFATDTAPQRPSPGSTSSTSPPSAASPRPPARTPSSAPPAQPGQGVECHHGSTVMVRDFATGKTAVEPREATAGPVLWSRDGGALAAGDGRTRVDVWDVRSGARLGRVVGHIDEVTHAAFTPDRKIARDRRVDDEPARAGRVPRRTLRRLAPGHDGAHLAPAGEPPGIVRPARDAPHRGLAAGGVARRPLDGVSHRGWLRRGGRGVGARGVGAMRGRRRCAREWHGDGGGVFDGQERAAAGQDEWRRP
ncbi:NADP-dependent alcohol dehydrogenase 6, partial [Tolypocladium capitatum]